MKKELLYEGKAKIVYKGEKEGTCIIEYKDTATAFNGEKKEDIQGKGELNNGITNTIFKMLGENGIPTHFIEEIDNTSILVKQVEIVPLEVIVRNVAAGSFSKKYGVPEGSALKSPILEFCYKDDSLGDPMLNNSHILALGLATEKELETLAELTMKINLLLIAFFEKANLKLIDFKIEFGRYNGEILLADEISPDTCRLWDKDTNEKLDKDRFRRNMGNVIDAYQEVSRRIGK